MEAMFTGIVFGLTIAAAIVGAMALAVKFINKRNAQQQDMRKAQRISTQEANHNYLRSIGYMK